ncbi:hypothetical protein OG21DRAFT_1518357 [Imleria badia]|nr:hypothetical protein OG21DRAFT_1518357 [Imleria badia]
MSGANEREVVMLTIFGGRMILARHHCLNDNVIPCTTRTTPYEMVVEDTIYYIWDTRGLVGEGSPTHPGASTRGDFT